MGPIPKFQGTSLKNFFVFLFCVLLTATASARGARVELGKQIYPFVGYGVISNRAAHCTYSIVRHGLLVTAKHCFEHRAQSGRPIDLKTLSIHFQNEIPILPESILQLTLDAGDNDIAWVTYDPLATQNKIQLPEIKISNEILTQDIFVEMPGSPAVENPRKYINVVSCRASGKIGTFPAKEFDPGYHGQLVETDCPAWYGQSGSPIYGREGSVFVLFGVLAHTFDVLENGRLDPDKLRSDSFGPYIQMSMFSPMSARSSYREP